MSLLKADTIKPVTSSGDLSLQGDSGGSAVDCLNITSAGDINFTGNTDAKIKLPSAGGIYESDGSTAVLTESGGVVTLANVDIKALVNASGSAPIYAARASGSVDAVGGTAYALQNLSYSSSSNTNTFTFTTAPSDANYSVCASVIRIGSDNADCCLTARSASAFSCAMYNSHDAAGNTWGVAVAVFF